jgi:GlpG protein
VQEAAFTLYIFLICIFLFFIGEMTTPNIVQLPPLKLPLVALFSPPINKNLMYDYPEAYERMDKFIKVYGWEGLQNYENLPPEGLYLLKKIIQTPVWDGLYSNAETYFAKHQPSSDFHAVLFEKIRQGQIWRIFTPCLLHANLLHILLNMLWLVYIGKIIETRLGGTRYLLLIVITAIVSNTAQYLMSGPNFLGFSGVLCGMLAFSWTRQKIAPWEGYRLAPGTYSFIFITIIAMAAIQTLSFFLKIYLDADYFPSIANTAHISGGIMGYFLGRMSLMGIRN